VKKLSLLIITLITAHVLFAQKAKIAGKVSNNKNEGLAGVTIKISGAITGFVKSDIDGRYTFSVEAGKKVNLDFSYVGYTTKTINDITVPKAGDVETVDVILEQGGKELETVVVKTAGTRTSGKGETVNAMLSFQKNTSTVASVISAETIKRSPDRNTGEVLKRIAGTSLQEGKFIIVRGLADRYNQAMLNGILLTSTEPDRKTFSFDLIPAAMIDNIIINKAFVPELPGEWAGGLIQVNTKDIPAKNFFNVQLGTGFNTQTIGQNFYKDKGGKTDWLGLDDGTRSLPSGYTTKSQFDLLSPADKTAIGKSMNNSWVANQTTAPLNASVQMNGGFTGKLLGKKIGGSVGILYNKTNRIQKLLNRQNTLAGSVFSINSDFADDRYIQEVMWGAIGSLSVQLNSLNKISVKSLVNINSNNGVTQRNGYDVNRAEDIYGSEFTFKQNTFYTTQLTGEHGLHKDVKLKWYGAFNILDGYVPDQRRIFYSKSIGTSNPYTLAISNSLSQQSGSRIYQTLSDYIYTAGGDVSYSFNLFSQKQTLKGGYMFQVKDRLYDAQLFANYLPLDNPSLRLLTADKVFDAANFGYGTGNKFGFDAIKGNTFRYMANTILNAGFLQLDNQLTNKLRVVWGLRVESYDQLVGSVKTWDPRHTYSKVLDYLPGINATYKLNNKTNIRLTGSQTVIRPELRELASLNLYDFELNASVQGFPGLQRTKISNFDLRYELYPRAGETFSAGVFYKNFENPIEQIFNEGAGGASTFTYRNAAKAEAYGVEIDFRKKLDFASALKNFTFQANASYIYSKIKDAGFAIDRSLQGQSPYTINMGLLYDLEKQGMNITLLFNQVGERIYLVGDLSSGAGSPDIYEAPRPLLDFQISKKVLQRKGEIKLNVSDILNQKQYFYQNNDSKTSFQKNKDAYRFTRQFGTTIGLTFNYSIL
jgi:outer membrane receptor protein involved in Fe transport